MIWIICYRLGSWQSPHFDDVKNGGEGDDDAVADECAGRQILDEGNAHIVLQQPTQPDQILLPPGLAEDVGTSEILDLYRLDAFDLRLQLGDVALEIITRRQLNE